MVRRPPGVCFALLFAAAACAASGIAGCGGPDADASSLAAPVEPHLDEPTEGEDPTPPNDDPGLGAVPVPDAADADVPGSDAGADAARPPVPPARVAAPVPGKVVTYPYGVKNSAYAAGYHTGDDYATPSGSNVVAVRTGTVRWSNDNGGAYGKWMGLDADNGRTYVYCHLSTRLLSAGTKVVAGQSIAKSGATGNVTGPHLHFEDHPLGPFTYGQNRKPAW